VRARTAPVDQQIERYGHGHRQQPCHQRQQEPAPLAELAQVYLATRLETHDEEEERHQAVVDPCSQVVRSLRVAESES
jgi:hypothetical protein